MKSRRHGQVSVGGMHLGESMSSINVLKEPHRLDEQAGRTLELKET